MTEAGMRVLDHAVLRAAAWPIETADAFAAPELAAAARAVLDAERSVLRRRDSTIGAVYRAVPRMARRPTRGYLLAVKRAIHRGADLLPDPDPEAAADIAADAALAATLSDEQENRSTLAARRATFRSAYESELRRQRHALRVATADPRFLRALMIANPTVARRWEVEHQQSPTNAQSRRLEATVLHYLMRAAGRPTPSGAWAGIVPVGPSEDGASGITVRPAAARYTVAVNLLPFAQVVAALAQMERYRRDFPLRLNPTLHRGAGGFCYERRTDGRSEWRMSAADPVVEAIVAYYDDGHPRQVEPLLRVLAGATASEVLRLRRGVDRCIEEQILQSALEFPPSGADAWESLDAVAARLLDADRVVWERAIARVRHLCDDLASRFEAMRAAEVDALVERISVAIDELWRWARCAGDPPEPAIYLDMRLPLAVSWGPADVAAATASVRDWLEFHAADQGAELLRRQSLQRVVDGCGLDHEVSLLALMATCDLGWSERHQPVDRPSFPPGAVEQTREAMCWRLPPDHPLTIAALARCRAWERVLEPVHGETFFVVPGAGEVLPYLQQDSGAVALRLTGEGAIWMGLGRPQPAFFVSRFEPLLREVPDQEAPIVDALRRGEALARPAGTTATEIIGRDSGNLNAALRPRLHASALDPYGEPAGWLRDVSLHLDREWRPWLRRGDEPDVSAPVYSSAAPIGSKDHSSWVLFKLAMGHGCEFLSLGFPPLVRERMRWGHLPRLVLPGGTVLSPRRWTLPGATVAHLAGSDGPVRYLQWRAEAEGRGLPDLVRVQCGPSAPELLLRTDSPLAIRALFDTVAAAAPWIQVTELPGDPGTWPIVDERGLHYAAELAVTWVPDVERRRPAPPREVEDKRTDDVQADVIGT